MKPFYPDDQEWKKVLQRLSEIRLRGEYSSEDVDFVREQLQSPDERIRGGAALAAEGCLFEPQIIDLLLELAEYDTTPGVRKAALQSLQDVIREGVEQGFENQSGAVGEFDALEEWSDVQEQSLVEQYQRVKHLFFQIMENEQEDSGLRQMALMALAYLGHMPTVQEWIREFYASDQNAARLVAVHAMGKFPQYWEEELLALIKPDTPKSLLLEAISSSFSARSPELARKIEAMLEEKDPDILSYALMTLANMNLTENLGELLQQFSLHENPRVQEAARRAIEIFTRRNFEQFIDGYFGEEDGE